MEQGGDQPGITYQTVTEDQLKQDIEYVSAANPVISPVE